MIILNFSHPLTDEQIASIEALTAQPIEAVHDLPTQFDNGLPFPPQLAALGAKIPLSAEELQTRAILVNPPALNFIAALVLAELHGRMGYFPPVVRLKPIQDRLPPRFEVAEILNLQAVRDAARTQRYGDPA